MLSGISSGSSYRKHREDHLICLALAGDHSAYEELMHRSWAICMRVAISSLRNREDAIEEVQDAFWKAYSHLYTFNRRSKFSTWVARIVINQCLVRLREKKRFRLVSQTAVDSSGEEYTMHQAIDRENPEDLLGHAELRALVRHELSRIPVLLRVPLELRYMQGLELDDVAGRLNITVAATKSRLHRAQQYLKDRMRKHCGARGFATLTRTQAHAGVDHR